MVNNVPVDRFFHPRAGHSNKVSGLTDFEFRVWWTYEMAADDYGVMRCAAVTLQAANDALAQKPIRVVMAALEKLVSVGLLEAFEHQGQRYVCQLTWQDFQKVRYPRESHEPTPTPEVLAKCSKETSELFARRSRRTSEIDPQSCGDASDSSLQFPRTGAREEANGLRLTANGKRSGGAMSGSLQRDHLNHAACDDTYSRCVPNPVHEKLANSLAPKHNGDRESAKSALKAWYPTIWATLSADFVIGDAFKFWQARFDTAFTAKVVTVAPAPKPRNCRHHPTCADDAAHTTRYLDEMRGTAQTA